jgi:hypothetical protein
VIVIVIFIRESKSVQNSARGHLGRTSRVIGRLYFCAIFGVYNSTSVTVLV